MTTPYHEPILIAVPKPARVAKDRKPLRKVNARRRRRALKEDFGDLAVVARALPCCVVGCGRGPCDPAHMHTRGAGNHAWRIDPNTGARVGNIAPLCRPHHDEQGRGVKSFDAAHALAVHWGGRSFPVANFAEAAAQLGRLVENTP